MPSIAGTIALTKSETFRGEHPWCYQFKEKQQLTLVIGISTHQDAGVGIERL